MTELFSFDTAVRRLTGQADQHSFAFFPNIRSGHIVGGTVFLLLIDHDEDKPYLRLFAESSIFGTSVGEEESYDLESLKDDAENISALFGVDPRALRYKACTLPQISRSMMMLSEYAVAILNGNPDLAPDSVSEASSVWSSWLTQHLPEV